MQPGQTRLPETFQSTSTAYSYGRTKLDVMREPSADEWDAGMRATRKVMD
jgi:hypothetical protein